MSLNQNALRKASTDVILRQAIEDNDIAQLKFVLRFEQVKINDQDENQMTSLHWSCVYGRLEIVALLLDNGADIEMKDSKGWTALHFAANSGHLDVVDLLLASCADVSATSNDGKVAIDVAQGEGMVFLLATGFIKAGKQDLLLRYFSDSTSSLRSIDENGEQINIDCYSQQNLTAVEIWRASQQFLTKEFSHVSKTPDCTLKVSTSDYGICKKQEKTVPKVEKNEVLQRKRSIPLEPQDQQTSSKTAQFLTLPRKSKLNNFDSSFSPGVLRRFAVSETNLNLPQAMDYNNDHNNNHENTAGERKIHGEKLFRVEANFEIDAMDSESFIAAEESQI